MRYPKNQHLNRSPSLKKLVRRHPSYADNISDRQQNSSRARSGSRPNPFLESLFFSPRYPFFPIVLFIYSLSHSPLPLVLTTAESLFRHCRLAIPKWRYGPRRMGKITTLPTAQNLFIHVFMF